MIGQCFVAHSEPIAKLTGADPSTVTAYDADAVMEIKRNDTVHDKIIPMMNTKYFSSCETIAKELKIMRLSNEDVLLRWTMGQHIWNSKRTHGDTNSYGNMIS